MDIPHLAQETAKILAPFLPYLIAGTKAAAEEAGKQFGKAAWDKAAELWGKLKPKVEANPDAKSAVEKAAGKPEDKRLLGNLEYEFEQIFEQDIEFAQTIKAGNYSVVIGRDMKNSVALNNSNGNQVANNITGPVTQTTNVYNNAPQSSSEDLKIAEARIKYLRSLRKSCYSLPLTALGDDKNLADLVTLENVYVNLDTLSFEPGKEMPDEDPAPLERAGKKKEKPISCMEAASREKRLVLLGNAGSGKSSFVKYLIAKQATVLLNEIPALEGFAANLLPVYIELRKLSPLLRAANIESPGRLDKLKTLAAVVFDYLNKELADRNAVDFLPSLKDAFEGGNILLVLDGLDEVPQKLRELVRLTVEALIQLHSVEKIVITSRLNAYSAEENKFKNFADHKIAPLDDEKINKFSEEWYQAQSLAAGGNLTPEEAKEKSRDLAGRAARTVPREMSGNPMMLTCIAIIHKSGKRFPEHRAVLYNQLVETLSSKWQEEKGGNADEELDAILRNKNKLRDVLARLAYEMHLLNSESGAGKENADITEEQAFGVLKRQPPFDTNRELAGKFLDYIYDRSGLFYSDGGEVTTYRFPHREIQEYLAGYHLIKQENANTLYWKYAEQKDYWSKPALLGAEEIIHNQNMGLRTLWLVMNDLCLKDPPKTEQAERALLWSGQIAVECGIENIPQISSQGEGYLKTLRDNTTYLLEESKFLTPIERAEAGNTLSRLGDPRRGVTGDFVFCEIPAGKFMLGEKGSDKSKYLEYTIPHNYFMSRYPVTNAQFHLFVKSDGYKKEEYWREAKEAGWWSRDGFKGKYDNETRTAPLNIGGAYALDNHPVVGVSWYEAAAFCNWLTDRMRNAEAGIRIYDPKTNSIRIDDNLQSEIVNRKSVVRLPSEAEWERAARGGHEFRYPWGADEITPDHANYNETNLNTTSAVGAFPKGMNAYGLLDMSGNVWEWCATAWQENYDGYLEKEKDNNKPEGDVARVLRGGAYYSGGVDLRCAYRDRPNPLFRHYYLGFRCVVCASFPISP
ncbi:MAG: SUMF1/EgtB/PvdO family nonheme iron enzyme [Chloroflexi bacterium]|nr:SUMF1/EgtB/PvdO family nonheme iron enzyme [Chloroflexota bacterium]